MNPILTLSILGAANPFMLNFWIWYSWSGVLLSAARLVFTIIPAVANPKALKKFLRVIFMILRVKLLTIHQALLTYCPYYKHLHEEYPGHILPLSPGNFLILCPHTFGSPSMLTELKAIDLFLINSLLFVMLLSLIYLYPGFCSKLEF
jgi:hypothetical protein